MKPPTKCRLCGESINRVSQPETHPPRMARNRRVGWGKNIYDAPTPLHVRALWRGMADNITKLLYLSGFCCHCWEIVFSKFSGRGESSDVLFAKAAHERLAQTLKKKRVRSERIVVDPTVRNQALFFLVIHAGFAGFEHNMRCFSQHMTTDADLWKHLATYRHHRKCLGIKGAVCKLVGVLPTSREIYESYDNGLNGAELVTSEPAEHFKVEARVFREARSRVEDYEFRFKEIKDRKEFFADYRVVAWGSNPRWLKRAEERNRDARLFSYRLSEFKFHKRIERQRHEWENERLRKERAEKRAARKVAA